MDTFQNGQTINNLGNERSKQQYIALSGKDGNNPDNSNLNGMRLLHFPVGMITMFGSGDIPVGWAICDGKTYTYPNENGVITTITTPDLRMNFVTGPTTFSDRIKLNQGQNNNNSVTYQRKRFVHNHDMFVSFSASNWEKGSDVISINPSHTSSSESGTTVFPSREIVPIVPSFVSLHYIMRIY